jgi:predicted DNA-binding transcriptional regulator AlpA
MSSRSVNQKEATVPPSVHLDDQLLTRVQVAELLGVTPRTMERYIARKIIPAPIRLGTQTCLRWRKSTIMSFLAKKEAEAQRSA